jgi:hypothetical protein
MEDPLKRVSNMAKYVGAQTLVNKALTYIEQTNGTTIRYDSLSDLLKELKEELEVE